MCYLIKQLEPTVMHSPNYILLPANRLFISGSLFAALFLNMLPWGQGLGVPDFLAVTIVFWSIHQPRKISMGVVFLLGLLMDVHHGNLLGENALIYTLLSYLAIVLHRKVLWLTGYKQIGYVLPLFLLAQIIETLLSFWASGKLVSMSFFLQSITTALLWPLITVLLLAPQKRVIDRDDTRPI